MKNKRVNICYWDNKGGLSLDAKLISEVLSKAEIDVFHNGYLKNASAYKRLKWKFYRIYFTLLSRFGLEVKRFSVNIHLEEIKERNLILANKNVMVPNLEWLRDETFELI